MGNFRKLAVWHKAQDLAVAVYHITAVFPASEQFGLTAQLRRAAVSVSSNIAEGSGRGTIRSFKSFVLIARGSLQELRSQLDLATRLGYVPKEIVTPMHEAATEVSRMLSGLLRSAE